MVNLTPFWQTVATVGGGLVTAALLVLVMLPRWGRVLRDRGRKLLVADPASEEGARLVARGVKFLRLGSDLRAFRDSPDGQKLPLPMRAILYSLPDSEPPEPWLACAKTEGCLRASGHDGACLSRAVGA